MTTNQDLPFGITHSLDDDGNDVYAVHFRTLVKRFAKQWTPGLNQEEQDTKSALFRVSRAYMGNHLPDHVRQNPHINRNEKLFITVPNDDEQAIIMTLIEKPFTKREDWLAFVEEFRQLEAAD